MTPDSPVGLSFSFDNILQDSTQDVHNSQPFRQAHQQNVFTRLQALFPPSPSNTHPSPISRHGSDRSSSSRPTSSRKSSARPPKCLKVRIVTWNMHESLPKGNLEELLGAVPSYTPPSTSEHNPTAIPNLSLEANHPYHIVVIAGQECPGQSGIPMGIGAGLKLKEKEKEPQNEAVPANAPLGWTSILEDWYCNGSGSGVGAVAVSDAGHHRQPIRPPARSFSTGDIQAHVNRSKQGKGPYELLTKERLMGIYLSVYVHRDVRSLVTGVSKSSVTAGLIGGRVGNKGGVGISLNIDGTTLLFVNAHLAAHEDKVHHRLADWTKIKAELAVDDFLKPDDPRVMAEDITDKYDYTFVCGDLNFRLDMTRLHADWLISRRDYAQALAFDQLRNIMQNGYAFARFHEADIDFPPTFKYDVLRTLKRSKKKNQSHVRHNSFAGQLAEIEGKEANGREEEEADEDDDAGEAASVASSYWTSVHSRRTTTDDREYRDSQPLTPSRTANSTGNLVQKLSIVTAAHKAKTKWKAMVSPSSTSVSKSARRSEEESSRHNETPPSPSPFTSDRVTESPTKLDKYVRQNKRSRTMSMKRDRSAKSSGPSAGDAEDEDKGVYDSSAKKRVPSWCDRILWKSTVVQDPEAEEDEVFMNTTRSRVGQFFAHAFRSRAARRQPSFSTINSVESYRKMSDDVISSPLMSPPVSPPMSPPVSPPMSPPVSPPVSDEGGPEPVLPFSRFSHRASSSKNLQHSNSTETFKPQSKSLARSVSHGSGARRSRPRGSSSPGSFFPRSKTIPTPIADPIIPPVSSDIPPHTRSKDAAHNPPRWRFLPFLYREPIQSRDTLGRPPTPMSDSPSARHRKGDVVCLSYDTLDDRGMRRLEGRSDHRPVIGSYAIYI